MNRLGVANIEIPSYVEVPNQVLKGKLEEEPTKAMKNDKKELYRHEGHKLEHQGLQSFPEIKWWSITSSTLM